MESFYFKIPKEDFDTCFEEITRLMGMSNATSFKQKSIAEQIGILVNFSNRSDLDTFIGKLQREIGLFIS